MQPCKSFDIEWVRQTKGLKLIHLNIRSLLLNLDEVKNTLLDGSFDIIALTETWLHSQCCNSLLEVDGYKLFRQDRKTVTPGGRVKRGGGICLYVKNEFNVVTWPTLSSSNLDLESLHVSCKLGNNRRVNLSVVYRPPSGKLQSAIDILRDNIDEIRKSVSGDTVLLGDFNTDYLNTNVQVLKLQQFADSFGLAQLITVPTRITHTTHTLIDHIYSDMSHISVSGTLNLNISDHLPIFLIKKKVRNEIKYKELRCRSYRNFNEASFVADIQAVDFFDIFVNNDPNDTWDRLYTHIMSVVDKYCPLRTLKIPLDKPAFLTDNIVQLMRERDRAFKAARKTNDLAAWRYARQVRCKVASEIRKSRRIFIADQLERVRGDSHKFWRVINREFFKEVRPKNYTSF